MNPSASQSPFPIDKNNPLEQLGDKYKPTKRDHNYLAYYWLHFRDVRQHVKSVLEIGVQTDKSIRMWEEFFPSATIWGMDIDPACKAHEGGRRKVLIGDQSDVEFLSRAATEAGGFDIIIDDGSHKSAHQITTFNALFPSLSSHGIYVIEDTGGCVGDWKLNTVNAMKAMIDHVMYWPQGFQPGNWRHLSEFPADAPWLSSNTIGVAFYRWIVFIMRGHNPQDNPYLRPLGDRPIK